MSSTLVELFRHNLWANLCLVDFCAELDDEQLNTATHATYGTYRGKPFAIPAHVFLVQAINHATEHRAQIQTCLTQARVQPPDLSGWAYAEQQSKDS